LNTGDLGRKDAEGYFWLTGRKKELIIRGGHNIDPAAIEQPLHRHPGVEIAVAVGRPDVHAGELPVAYVKPKRGVTLEERELLAFLAREIGERAALPRRIHVVENIPLTAVGKVFKPELRRREAQDALETALREANVPFSALRVSLEASGGMSVRVELEDGAPAGAAREVLGRFTFPFALG
jgi:fatty-acyl-CoA synthase